MPKARCYDCGWENYWAHKGAAQNAAKRHEKLHPDHQAGVV